MERWDMTWETPVVSWKGREDPNLSLSRLCSEGREKPDQVGPLAVKPRNGVEEDGLRAEWMQKGQVLAGPNPRG